MTNVTEIVEPSSHNMLISPALIELIVWCDVLIIFTKMKKVL